jgi:fructose-specific phosphotransferase system component IIB
MRAQAETLGALGINKAFVNVGKAVNIAAASTLVSATRAADAVAGKPTPKISLSEDIKTTAQVLAEATKERQAAARADAAEAVAKSKRTQLLIVGGAVLVAFLLSRK